LAFKLSIPVVTTFPYRESVDNEAIQQDLNYIGELSKLAASRGITLAVKPHIGTSFHDTTTLIQMLHEINSPALGVNLDLLQLFKVGNDPSEAILKIGRGIVHTHFHDCPNRGQSRETPEEQIPGRSDINFPKILRRLKDVGYDKALSVHVVGGLTYPLSSQMGIAAEARGYLNRCLQELNPNNWSAHSA
jgi:sugar phosphate isomerase/epimerase